MLGKGKVRLFFPCPGIYFRTPGQQIEKGTFSGQESYVFMCEKVCLWTSPCERQGLFFG